MSQWMRGSSGERDRERERGGRKGEEAEGERQKIRDRKRRQRVNILHVCMHVCVHAASLTALEYLSSPLVHASMSCHYASVCYLLSLCICLWCAVCVCVCVCVCTCLCVSPRSPVYMFVCAHDLSLAVYLWTQLSFPGCVTLSTCLNFVSAVGSACVVESIAIGTFRILIKMSWFPRCVNITLHWGFSSPLFRDFFRFEYMLWVYWRCTMLAKSRRNRQTLHYHFPGSMSFQFTDL